MTRKELRFESVVWWGLTTMMILLALTSQVVLARDLVSRFVVWCVMWTGSGLSFTMACVTTWEWLKR